MHENRHNITLFENNYGDSFIVRIYCEKLERHINILFDMGKGTKKLIETNVARDLDGIFVTHIDSDHITGIIQLLKNDDFKKDNKLSFIVFNKFNKALISYTQGNQLSEEVNKQNIMLVESYRSSYDGLNIALSQKNIPITFFSKNKRSLLPNIRNWKQKIYITFLLPDEKKLANFMYEWEKDNIKKNSGKTGPVTNRSSIVCLIEFVDDYNKFSILLTGDGYMSDIKSILDRYSELWSLDKLDCIKISHHGSRENNLYINDLISTYSCNQLFYLSKKGVSIEDTLKDIPHGITIIRGNEDGLESTIRDRLKICSCFNIGG